MTSTDLGTAAARLSELTDVLNAYRTCELVTMSKAGVPITWPAVCLPAADGSAITLTTCIALPQKAYNIRRDPRVALLFSDPTGSGRSDLPQVLVQGSAVCPAQIHTSPAGLEAYWSRLGRLQPMSKAYGATALGRRLFDWYYMRLVITVTPERVVVREPLSAGEPMTAFRPGRSDRSAYAEVGRRLGGYPSGVLAALDQAGDPTLHRVRLMPVGGGRLALSAQGAEQQSLPGSGPANLLCHAHDDKLWNLEQFGAIGRIELTESGVALVPERLLAGAGGDGPLALVATIRRLRRTAARYLAKRNLARPEIAWGEFGNLTS